MACNHALDGNLYISSSAESLYKAGSNSSNNRDVIASSAGSNLATRLKMKFFSSHKCVTAKAAQLTLFWALLVGFMFGYFYNLSLPTVINKNKEYRLTGIYIVVASFYCFYPIVGFLADVQFGRYRTILRSMQTLCVLLLITSPVVVLLTALEHATWKECVLYLWVASVFSLMAIFCANSIQFGMDQLHDSPSDHQSIFIHWYVCTWYAGVFASLTVLLVIDIEKNHQFYTILVKVIASVSLVFSLAFSLCIARQKKHWFLMDNARANPYKMVYEVTKFARHCKVPIQRSAFTYCEDKIPSGLDLGKAKYGGPFTVEQVEDVKAFYGILKVVLAVGPVFFLKISTDRVLNDYFIFNETNLSLKNTVEVNLLGNGLLSYVIILVTLPLYIILIRPFVDNHLPGILRRLGLGILLVKVTLISIFILHAIPFKAYPPHEECFYFNESPTSSRPIILSIPCSLNAFSNMLIYIALYEFVCSQSPHAMKGSLIGLTFAVKGVFELIGTGVLILFLLIHPQSATISCSMIYYLLNILIAVISFLAYVIVSKKYKYRVRDEICNVYRYVEEYYSKKLEADAARSLNELSK